MNILSIDFGLSKIGVGIATSKIADPYIVIRYKNEKEVFDKLKNIIEKENIEKIIVGISEGEMAVKTREFIEGLKKEVNIPVEEFDETLTTFDAQKFSQESGMRRSKRREMEDAIAAAVMLQNYLDTL